MRTRSSWKFLQKLIRVAGWRPAIYKSKKKLKKPDHFTELLPPFQQDLSEIKSQRSKEPDRSRKIQRAVYTTLKLGFRMKHLIEADKSPPTHFVPAVKLNNGGKFRNLKFSQRNLEIQIFFEFQSEEQKIKPTKRVMLSYCFEFIFVLLKIEKSQRLLTTSFRV